MLNVLFTLDYEIHGNGDGSPHDLMVEPTARMLDLFDAYGAKLTIMADVAEILKFREYRDQFGRDDYHYEAIVAQLQDAIRRGHDVQLHLHCSYFNARFENGKWQQDWTEYNFAGLSEERINEVLGIGKTFLEEQLRTAKREYRCNVFRAGNWAVAPSRGVVRALINNGFEIDTSVFKDGQRNDHLVRFDYSEAPSELVPWRASEADICRRDDESALLEVPIYCELRPVAAFLSVNRLYRSYLSRNHRFNVPNLGGRSNCSRKNDIISKLLRKHPWKADFNQCTGKQLIAALNRAEFKYGSSLVALPFVLIGHSKLFTRYNEKTLSSFLHFIAKKSYRSRFGTFDDLRQGTPGRRVQSQNQELCPS
ncbi:MAG: hypothetical protein QOH39_2177 [Verrucomicrobiota bacterium]|jgi:hypothetical protein